MHSALRGARHPRRMYCTPSTLTSHTPATVLQAVFYQKGTQNVYLDPQLRFLVYFFIN